MVSAPPSSSGPSSSFPCAALSIGLNYSACYKQVRLNGCHNDSDNFVKYLLEERRDVYDQSNVTQLKDEPESKEGLYATSRVGITEHVAKLVARSHKHNLKQIVLHYSGHGTQKRAPSGDASENDGKNEAIVPWDFQNNGVILDDKINEMLQDANPSTNIVWIFDCCHSGTMCDLPYRYDVVGEQSTDHGTTRETRLAGGKETPCKVTALSGCKDSQVSMGAFDVDGEKEYSGAMSTCLLALLTERRQWKTRELLPALHDRLKQKGFSQKPVLTSSAPIAADDVFL